MQEAEFVIPNNKAELREYEFTLVLSGYEQIDSRLEDGLFEAGCDDALLRSLDGCLLVDFTRVGESFDKAVLGAIRDVESADLGITVSRIQPENYVTASEIARRTGRSRESIRQLIEGERGSGGFPAPITNIGKMSPAWLWADITPWLTKHGLVDKSCESIAVSMVVMNALIDISRWPETFEYTMEQIWNMGEEQGQRASSLVQDLKRIFIQSTGYVKATKNTLRNYPGFWGDQIAA